MKHALLEMMRQIRDFTRKLLQDTSPAYVRWAPKGTSNHMLWHAGHAIWLQDLFCVERLSGHSELPKSWERKFGMRCEPVATQTDWPSLEEVQERLASQQLRMRELMEGMTPSQLVIEVDNRRDLVGGIIHGLHDEAKHQGEMYLLHKLCQAESEARR